MGKKKEKKSESSGFMVATSLKIIERERVKQLGTRLLSSIKLRPNMAPHKHPDTAHEEIVTNLEVKSAAHLKTNKHNFQFLFFYFLPNE